MMNDGCGAKPSELLRTSNQGSLWLRTPSAFSTMMEAARSEDSSGLLPRSGMYVNGTLSQLPTLVPRTKGIASGLWPTPTPPAWIPCPCCDNFLCTIHDTHVHDCDCPPIEEWQEDPYKPKTMWPTPTARDYKGPCWSTPARDCLDHAVERGETKNKTYPKPQEDGGRLNPTWVEWLMGYPPAWTALDASETQSSHKSQKSSAVLSSNSMLFE